MTPYGNFSRPSWSLTFENQNGTRRSEILAMLATLAIAGLGLPTHVTHSLHAHVSKKQDLILPYCDEVMAMEDNSPAAWDALYDKMSEALLSMNDPHIDACAFFGKKDINQTTYDNFIDYWCSPEQGGQAISADPVSGIEYKTDAYYCGHPDLAWDTMKSQPVADLCTVPLGSAYTKTGLCGSRTSKELLLNACMYIPLWMKGA